MPRRKLFIPRIVRELKRRRVFRSTATYIVAAWVMIEVSSAALEVFAAPDWVLRYLVFLAVALFPLMLFVSWRFDLTRSGFVRTLSDLYGKGELENDDTEDRHVVPEGISGSERRILSVLVCRLEECTGEPPAVIARQLESQRQRICSVIVPTGILAKTAPDEVLVYFGYPVAYEDDASRAIRTGLAILAKRDGGELNPAGLAVAVHTGLVVVPADDADVEAAVLTCPVVDSARCLQDEAGKGILLASQSCWKRVTGYFEGEEAAAVPVIEGIGIVYRVNGETGVKNRLELRKWQELTPLAGRARELDSLEQNWQSAKEGAGQVVLLSGDPGIGKSRLVEAIKRTVDSAADAALMTAYCAANRSNSSLYPFTALLLDLIPGLGAEVDAARRLDTLQNTLIQAELHDREDFVLLAILLGLEIGDVTFLERMSPPMRMQRTVSALLSLVLAHNSDQSLLLVVEDLHWADPSSLALLDLIVDHTATSALLVLLTFRPEFTAPWSRRTHVQSMQLSGLKPVAVAELISSIAGAEYLSDAVLEAVIRKTDGVPLFVEEVVKIILEAPGSPGQKIDPSVVEFIPDTLQESLMARLDQLGESKAVLQLGAMLGREFSYKLLSAAAGLDVEQLQGLLSDLLDAEMLFQKGVPPRASYEFKHALMQEAAYRSLLRKDRLANHCRIANLLIERFSSLVESNPEIVAGHFARGNQPASACSYYLKAGVMALQKSAVQEAADSVSRGLAQVERLPPGTDRDRLELGLRMLQGPAFMATVGFSDPLTREVYERALDLSTALQDTESLIPILFGLWIHHGARGELRHTLDLAEQIRDIAEQAQDPDLLLESYVVMGCATFHMGELSTCIENLQSILENYQLEKHAQHAYMFGQDPLTAGAAYLGSALWCQGQADRGFEAGEKAIAQAREIMHPYSLALALVFVARIHQMNRDPAAVARLAGEAVQVGAEFGFPTWQGFGLILLGWAQAQLGEVEAGLTTTEQGLSLCRLIQLGVSRAYFLSMAAEVKLLDGDTEGALFWLEQAQDEIATHGVQLEQPETCRVRALLESRRGNTEQALTWIEEGIRLARENSAHAWEIRCLCEKLELLPGAPESAVQEQLQQLLVRVPDSPQWPDLARARTLLARS